MSNIILRSAAYSFLVVFKCFFKCLKTKIKINARGYLILSNLVCRFFFIFCYRSITHAWNIFYHIRHRGTMHMNIMSWTSRQSFGNGPIFSAQDRGNSIFRNGQYLRVCTIRAACTYAYSLFVTVEVQYGREIVNFSPNSTGVLFFVFNKLFEHAHGRD